jgi:cold shock protein
MCCRSLRAEAAHARPLLILQVRIVYALGMPLANDILSLVTREPGLTEIEIAKHFFGRLGYQGDCEVVQSDKGYGFLQPTGGRGNDVFVHISAVERAGLSSLNEGQTIEYEIESNRGKDSAVNLRIK